MVKIGAELPKLSQKLKLGIRFLDHPVRLSHKVKHWHINIKISIKQKWKTVDVLRRSLYRINIAIFPNIVRNGVEFKNSILTQH